MVNYFVNIYMFYGISPSHLFSFLKAILYMMFSSFCVLDSSESVKFGDR